MFKMIKMLFFKIFHVFFRHYYFPCPLGLVKIGNPDENSPVFLTGNYTLTVQRLKEILKGTDCYLLIANSKGSNVWCAAGMDEFNAYDIIDAITVSNLKDIVKTRKIISPPYGAPGVRSQEILDKTGFRLVWGPTHMRDLKRFIQNGYKRTEDMIYVKFPFVDRMEQALSTALNYCLTIAVLLFFWPMPILKIMMLIGMTFIPYFALWFVFPVERFWRRMIIVLIIAEIIIFSIGYFLLGWGLNDYLFWMIAEFFVILSISMDSCGCSSVYKTTVIHWLTRGNYKSLFKPIIDPEKCIKCYQCVQACPQGVIARRRKSTAVVVNADNCIECLACLKQCTSEAFYNRTGEYKGDVKSVPNLKEIMTRDWSHLSNELRWDKKKKEFKNGVYEVLE